MRTTKQARRRPGRYTAAALAAAASAAAGAEANVIPIVLSSDWSGSAGYGSSGPGWYVDTWPAGPAVVHLQGAVQQVSTTAAANPNVIGLLPRAARPPQGEGRIASEGS